MESRRDSVGLLRALQKLYGDTATKRQLRTQFYNYKQEPQETVETFILKLREMHVKWQEKEPVGGDGEADLLDQFSTGLQPGPLWTEIHRQRLRNPQLTFAAVRTEAEALERELPLGDNAVWNRRTFEPRTRGVQPCFTETPTQDLTQLKRQYVQSSKKNWGTNLNP